MAGMAAFSRQHPKEQGKLIKEAEFQAGVRHQAQKPRPKAGNEIQDLEWMTQVQISSRPAWRGLFTMEKKMY